MGTWGAKNFQNDTAGDYYLLFIDRMLSEIRITMRMESQLHAGSYWSDVIPCMIEMITHLGRAGYHRLGLDVDEIRRWKRKYMYMWKATIPYCDPTEEYLRERETVLNRTFDELIDYVEHE